MSQADEMIKAMMETQTTLRMRMCLRFLLCLILIATASVGEGRCAACDSLDYADVDYTDEDPGEDA